MKIAVIAASGKAGRLIANEAYLREHEVTAIIRSPNPEFNDKYGIIVKDLFDLEEADLEDFDIVVNAFNSPMGEEHLHKTAMRRLIGIMENLPDIRFFVVGGAASLYTDASMTKMVITMIPPQFAALPQSMLEAFGELKTSKVNWTFMSPAYTFDANGPRTGRYTLGTDFLINNRAGQSYISYADFAVALVDEIERGDFICKRFTAVSDTGPEQGVDELPFRRVAKDGESVGDND